MNLEVTCSSYPANLVRSCLCKEGKCTRQREKETQSVTFAAGCLRKYFLFLYKDVCWASALWNIQNILLLKWESSITSDFYSKSILWSNIMQGILSFSLAVFQTPNAGLLQLIHISVTLQDNPACQEPYATHKCHIHTYIQQYINAGFSIGWYPQCIPFCVCTEEENH